MINSGLGSRSTEGIALDDAVTQMLEGDPDTAQSYLFYRWFSQWMETIRLEREEQGLTQKDLAESLNTTQSSIARLENDRRGSITVRRLWEYAFAVGVSPLVEFRPASGLMSFVKQHPDAQLRAEPFDAWVSPSIEQFSQGKSASHIVESFTPNLAWDDSAVWWAASQRNVSTARCTAIASEYAKLTNSWQSSFTAIVKAAANAFVQQAQGDVQMIQKPVSAPEAPEPVISRSSMMQKLAA